MTSHDNREHGVGQPNVDLGTIGAVTLRADQRSFGDLTHLLSPEQLAFTETLVVAMSEDLGVPKEALRLIQTEEEGGSSKVILMDSSPNGQFIGLYRDILAQREADPTWYTLIIGDQRIDPLEACTRTSYAAMIAEARSRGEQFLPDSLALNQHNGHVWTATMMTGDPLESEGHIWIGSSSSYDKVNFIGQPIHRGGKSFRVRAGVVVAQLEAPDE